MYKSGNSNQVVTQELQKKPHTKAFLMDRFGWATGQCLLLHYKSQHILHYLYFISQQLSGQNILRCLEVCQSEKGTHMIVLANRDDIFS